MKKFFDRTMRNQMKKTSKGFINEETNKFMSFKTMKKL